MAFSKVTVKVPDVAESYGKYSTPAEKSANVAMLKKIKNQYASSISTYGKALGIPDGVLVAFIASESGGTPVQVTNPSGAARFDVWGVMAISPAGTYDSIVNWKNHVKNDSIPADILAKINKKLPGLVATKQGTVMSDSVKLSIRNALKSDMDFNILSGSMMLRWLFERFSVAGISLFNKALVSYNAGLYQPFLRSGKSTSPDLTPKDTATLVADKKVPLESRSYLLKVLGKDGFMDLYYGQKLV